MKRNASFSLLALLFAAGVFCFIRKDCSSEEGGKKMTSPPNASQETKEKPPAAAHTNRLADETSPYLLQHVHNPVNWYPWGKEALDRAKKENKPIFLSIGYSACHWCHVMERESFEDPKTAEILNQHFIAVKVDREERPDIDEIYMTAVQLMTGGGGWPLSVFLTPDLKPFFGGTYFPPETVQGMPGFKTVLTRVAELWRERHDDVTHNAEQMLLALQKNTSQEPSYNGMPDGSILALVSAQLGREFDPRWGGFGGAPKFPPSGAIAVLLRQHAHTGEEGLLQMATVTLDRMALGGMYDQIGGGFHRYSVDPYWLVPHFEKMLYDNALLSRVYLEAWQVTGNDFYRRIATETLDYVLRDMTDAAGVSDKQLLERLQPMGKKLLAERDKRVRPGKDDKVLAAWNGMMISAFARGYQVTGDDRYLEAAARAADFVLTEMVRDGVLLRTYRGTSKLPGYLDDYAEMALGLVDLYEAGFDRRWLQAGEELAGKMVSDFWDQDDGGFFYTSEDHKNLLVRTKPFYDGAVPSGNATATQVLLRLSRLLGREDYRNKAEAVLRTMGDGLRTHPRAYLNLLSALDFQLNPTKEIAIAGESESDDTARFLEVIHGRFVPNKILALVEPNGVESEPIGKLVPLLSGKSMIEGKATVYVCENFTCKQPTDDPVALRAMLDN